MNLKVRQNSGDVEGGGDKEKLGAEKGKEWPGHSKQVLGSSPCLPGEQSAFGLTRRVQHLRSPIEVSEFICLPQEWHLRNTSHLLEATAGPDFACKVAPLTEALVPFSWQPGGSGGCECSP